MSTKKKKWSDCVIAGYAKVDGKQCRNALCSYGAGNKLKSLCVMGAAYEGGFSTNVLDFRGPFKELRLTAIKMNDDYQMKWEDIVGIAKAEGY